MSLVVLVCLLAPIASWLLTYLLRTVALRRGMLDIPNSRSSHTVPTPRGGGLSFLVIFFVWCILLVLFSIGWSTLPDPASVLVLLLPLALVGYVDDIRGLSARFRLCVHAGLAFLMTEIFPAPDWMNYTGIAVPYWFDKGFRLLGVMAYINFYNFMDGLDGLVTGTCLVQFTFFAFILGQWLWLPLIGGLAGFFVWNWSPAKIFMGDAASTTLGCAAAMAILSTANAPAPLPSALAVTLPLTIDASYTVLCRALQGENILQPHRRHIFQRLHHQAGWSHKKVSSVYIALTAGIAVAVASIPACAPGTWLLCVLLVPVAEIYLKKHARSAQSQ